jgi:hypothetical protein
LLFGIAIRELCIRKIEPLERVSRLLAALLKAAEDALQLEDAAGEVSDLDAGLPAMKARRCVVWTLRPVWACIFFCASANSSASPAALPRPRRQRGLLST